MLASSPSTATACFSTTPAGAARATGTAWVHLDVAAGRRCGSRVPEVAVRRADGRVGGLGLSGGAKALIESAARREDLRAVVAEGAGLRVYGDPLDVPGKGKCTVPYTTCCSQRRRSCRAGRRLGPWAIRRRRPARPGAADRRGQRRRLRVAAEPDLGGARARARSALGTAGREAHRRARRGAGEVRAARIGFFDRLLLGRS